MANILSKYVKFVRGTSAAFANLPIAQRANDTLYFIADEDAVIGELWLGNTLIAKGASEGVAATKLSELLDVDISNVQNNQYLGYDANKGKWVPLNLLVTINDVAGLRTELDNKVNKVYYSVPAVDENGEPVTDAEGNQVYDQVEGLFLSPADQDKLDALVITEDGVEISGTVNAANVEDLNVWITKHRNDIAGLYPTTEEEKINSALASLSNLNDSVIQTSTKVDSIANQLTDFVHLQFFNEKMALVDNDIDLLKDAVTWQLI